MGNKNLKGPLDQIFICSEENVGKVRLPNEYK